MVRGGGGMDWWHRHVEAGSGFVSGCMLDQVV